MPFTEMIANMRDVMRVQIRNACRARGWTMASVMHDEAKAAVIVRDTRTSGVWAQYMRIEAERAVEEAGAAMNMWPEGTVAGAGPLAKYCTLDEHGKIVVEVPKTRPDLLPKPVRDHLIAKRRAMGRRPDSVGISEMEKLAIVKGAMRDAN